MEIKELLVKHLSQEQREFVNALTLKLWDVEEPHLPPLILQHHGSKEEVVKCAINDLGKIWIAYDNVTPVAFIAGHSVTKGEINKLVVDDAYRRRGIGRLLVNAFKLSTGLIPWVNITPGNTGAVGFYTSLGFEMSEQKYHTPQGEVDFLIGRWPTEIMGS